MLKAKVDTRGGEVVREDRDSATPAGRKPASVLPASHRDGEGALQKRRAVLHETKLTRLGRDEAHEEKASRLLALLLR